MKPKPIKLIKKAVLFDVDDNRIVISIIKHDDDMYVLIVKKSYKVTQSTLFSLGQALDLFYFKLGYFIWEGAVLKQKINR